MEEKFSVSLPLCRDEHERVTELSALAWNEGRLSSPMASAFDSVSPK